MTQIRYANLCLVLMGCLLLAACDNSINSAERAFVGTWNTAEQGTDDEGDTYITEQTTEYADNHTFVLNIRHSYMMDDRTAEGYPLVVVVEIVCKANGTWKVENGNLIEKYDDADIENIYVTTNPEIESTEDYEQAAEDLWDENIKDELMKTAVSKIETTSRSTIVLRLDGEPYTLQRAEK